MPGRLEDDPGKDGEEGHYKGGNNDKQQDLTERPEDIGQCPVRSTLRGGHIMATPCNLDMEVRGRRMPPPDNSATFGLHRPGHLVDVAAIVAEAIACAVSGEGAVVVWRTGFSLHLAGSADVALST